MTKNLLKISTEITVAFQDATRELYLLEDIISKLTDEERDVMFNSIVFGLDKLEDSLEEIKNTIYFYGD